MAVQGNSLGDYILYTSDFGSLSGQLVQLILQVSSFTYTLT